MARWFRSRRALPTPLPTSVKAPNEQLKRMRSTSKGTLHFIAQSLANKYCNQVTDAAYFITHPAHEWIQLARTAARTPDGSVQWSLDLVNGSFDRVLLNTFRVFQSAELAHQLRLTPHEDGRVAPNALVKQETELCGVCLKLACHFMHNMQTSCLSITETLLGRLLP